MAPMRVTIAATAVVLCLLEYGLTADISQPETTTKIAAGTGGTTLQIGKREAYVSTTVNPPTVIPNVTTTDRLGQPVKRQGAYDSTTVVAPTGVPQQGKRQVTNGPTTVVAIDTTTAATSSGITKKLQKRQVSDSPATTGIFTPTATVSNQPSIAPTVTASNRPGKRQTYSSSQRPYGSGSHDDHDPDDHNR